MTKKLITFLFIVLPLFAVLISFLFNINVLGSIVIFLFIPSLILSIVQSPSIIKSSIFASISIPTLLIIDYISHRMGQWIVPITVFPFKLFNLVPIEDSIWAFFLTYEVIMFYEYFLDSQKKNEFIKKRFIPLLLVSFIIPILWLFIGFYFPILFQMHYFYALWGTVLLLIPLFLFLFKYPNLIKKFLITGIYFLYLNLCYELTALAKKWWFFPQSSQFIGWINIRGLFFPLEEFIFYVMIFAMGVLVWYEYFDDDRK